MTDQCECSDTKTYKDDFDLNDGCSPAKSRRALDKALDTRKFEIELYWKRGTYFWALIAATFAAYFAIAAGSGMPAVHFLIAPANGVSIPYAVPSEDSVKAIGELFKDVRERRQFYIFAIACAGFIFTWAWFLVNRGSKSWQENWENHVYQLEDKIIGPLFKTTLGRMGEKETRRDILVSGPMDISVSKINQWVSLFTLFIWLALIAKAFPAIDLAAINIIAQWDYFLMAALTISFTAMLFWGTRSHKGNHHHKWHKRESYIMSHTPKN